MITAVAPSLLLAVALLIGMIVCEAIGHRLGRRAADGPEGARAGASTIEAAVLALLGLLLAFSFSAAASRLDHRRQLIVQECNDIGTAWLRIDLVPPEQQPALRDLFRRYADARIGIVDALPDLEAASRFNLESIRLQGEIWPKAVEASRGSQQASMLLLPAINEMIDITTTRAVAARTHQPALITALIFAVALLSGLIAGYGMCDRTRLNRIQLLTLGVVVSVTVYVILDLEDPRAGLIRLDHVDSVMKEVRESMK